jgi:hypothetical protein
MEAQKLVENLRRGSLKQLRFSFVVVFLSFIILEHVVLFFCYVIIAEQLYRSSSDARIRTRNIFLLNT